MKTSKPITRVERMSVEHKFRDALSYIPVHNHLIRAYHSADMYTYTPPYDLMWRVSGVCVPESVHNAIDAQSVAADIRQCVALARAAIESVHSELDQEVEHCVYHSPDYPYLNLHASVSVTRHTAPGYASGWSYTYNPYLLAVATLDEYEQFIDTIMDHRMRPFRQLSRICQKAKILESNTALVAGVMWRCLGIY